MGGSQIALFFIFILGVVSMLLIFLYGAIVAYKGTRSKSSLGMLVGVVLILLGLILYSMAAIVFEYNNQDRESAVIVISVALIFLTSGVLLKAVSFIAYVKQHNKLLQAKNYHK